MPALQVDTTVACCDMINLVHNHCCSCCDNDSYCLLSTSPASVHSFAQDCRVQDSKRSDVNPKTQSLENGKHINIKPYSAISPVINPHPICSYREFIC